MCRVSSGTRRAAEVVAVDGEAQILPLTQFAPGHENANIRFTFRRGGELSGVPVTIEIKNRDDDRVYYNNGRAISLMDRPDAVHPAVIEWNGRDTAGELVTPQKSPYQVILKIGDAITRTKKIKVMVHNLEIRVNVERSPANSFLMNTPSRKMEANVKVRIRNSRGRPVRIKTPIKVFWSFEAHANNMAKSDSYEYSSGNRLGKKGDSTAVYWERDSRHPSGAEHIGSDNRYRTTCWVRTLVATNDTNGRAYIKFKSSGCGGDKFRLKASIIADESGRQNRAEARQRVDQQTNFITIMRRVRFTGREMPGARHVSSHGSESIMGGFYTNTTYVIYSLSMGADLTDADYIGLWNHSSTSYRTWSTWKSKVESTTASRNEKPPDSDFVTAQGGGTITATDRDAARTRIENWAQRWADRIYNAYSSALRHWLSDNSIGSNSLIGVKYEHPKISHNSPNSDAVTNEWRKSDTQSWLHVTIEGDDVHPDDRWIRSMGLSSNNRAYIFNDSNTTELRKTIAHEIGHETKSQFQRALFRPASVGGPANDSDHTNGPGLMDPSGSGSNFTASEKNILRGRDNP
ncbi:MAG: hypothetical protein KAR42_06455 [candidate division Zixibacteria bacterium]|nr:hypothetical protein [candidate division Zixibacteria bacterium]